MSGRRWTVAALVAYLACIVGANAGRSGYEGDRDFVIVPRSSLFEFFGQVALPPGSGAPSDMDCAPIASRIIEWVEAHDLSDLYFGLGGAATEGDRLAERLGASRVVDGQRSVGGPLDLLALREDFAPVSPEPDAGSSAAATDGSQP